MIPKQQESLCIRCGKMRIFKRKWKEVLLKGPAVFHVETVCPDTECQKVVDADFTARREKREAMENNKRNGIKISKQA